MWAGRSGVRVSIREASLTVVNTVNTVKWSELSLFLPHQKEKLFLLAFRFVERQVKTLKSTFRLQVASQASVFAHQGMRRGLMDVMTR